MKSSRQLRTKLTAIILGLLGTLAASLGFYTGVWDRVERLATDFRFRHFNRMIGDSGQVAMVVIDDEALAGIGDWPWPRTHLAKIIDLLNELESRQILIDLVFSMPKSGDAVGGADASEDEDLGEDDQLARACREQGQVILSTYFTDQPVRTAVYDRLVKDISQSPATLAARAQLPLRQVEVEYRAMLRQAARTRVMDLLTANPALSRDEVVATIVGPAGSSLKDPIQEIEQAYGYIQAYRYVRDKLGWLIEEKDLPAPIHRADGHRQMVLPIAKLAMSCADIGFVDFDRDPEGKVREMSLLRYYDGRIYRHLAMTGLCEYLEVEPTDFRMGPSTVELTGGRTGEGKNIVLTGDGQAGIRIPMTRDGKMIINWYAPPGKPHYWEKDSPNVISAARLLRIAMNQEALRQNRRLLAEAMAVTVKNFLPADQYERHQKLTRRLAMLHEGVHDVVAAQPAAAAMPDTAPASQPASQPTTSTAPATLEQELVMNYQETKAQVEKIEKEAREQLDWLHEQLADLTPREQAEGKNPLIRSLWRCLYRPREVQRINADLEASIDQKIDEVAAIVRGKIVLIGYTATTLADFVSTPVSPHTPGVVVHANILNQVLQGAFLSESDRNGDLLVILVLGTMATLLAAQRSEFEGLLWMLVLLAGFFFFTCEVIFERLHIVSSLVGPMVAVVLSWSLVSFYRRLTEGRAKRVFAGRLSQYTSPALARRIADDPDGLALVPEDRKITCFFSDIAGFTSLSEKLGPEQTVRFLNIYLEHASEVLDDHEAFINKFLGDGIFAFFNPPLHAQDDHARRACLAAVETIEALPHIQEHLREAIPAMTKPLAVRIGISTGPAVVGDCGSKRKFDYTCLGDTVNLASRMEAANKFFGTRILICQATREEMGDDLLVRPLGKIRVVGRERPVVVCELIGLTDKHADRAEFAALFEDMVLEYWEGRFEKAGAILDELEKMDPDDKPVKIYRGLLEKIRASGKQSYHGGVIEMETK